LRTIASPFSPAIKTASDPKKALELYRCSIKNRISLLYLEALRKKENMDIVKSVYEKKQKKYLETSSAIVRASQILANINTKHAIYKTVRPYKATTVDIDVLIFKPRNSYRNAINAMYAAGYKIIEYGPRSTTLQDPEVHIGIDLYEQVAVSFITYMDKEKLIDYVTSIRLPSGECVKTLKPEADLAAIIAHSVMKEQLYTLSEYYTFIHYLKQMNIDNFIQIVKQNNITSAARTHAAITALLHKAAHETIPDKLQILLSNLDAKTCETTLLIRNNFKTPHRYHMLTVAQSFLEIAKGKKCRNSIATQFLHMLNPKFTRKFLRALMEHVTRETY